MSNHPATHPPELDWPFFDNSHRDFKVRLDAWCQEHLAHAHHDESRDAVDAECIRLVRLLGAGGWLKHAVSGVAYGAASDVIDTRQLCLLRETTEGITRLDALVMLDRRFPVAAREFLPGFGVQLLHRPAAGLVDLLAAENAATRQQYAKGKRREYR